MTDFDKPAGTGEPERAETPAARAARRARRIGGRVQAEPAAEPATEPATAAAEPAGTQRSAAEPAAAEPDRTGTPPARPPWLAWLPALALALVCLAFAGWGAYDSHGVWWAKGSTSIAGERGPVLAAAKSCMATMNTYDYRKLDKAEAQGLACTTGALTGQYKKAFDTLIKKNAQQTKFTQTAQVNNAGIERVSGDGEQWVVLIFGQLSTTNSQTGTSTPTLTPFSARVTMQQVGAKWLVADYQYAPPT